MKEKLIKFLENHTLFKYGLDGGAEQLVRDALDDFFDQYQPERLNEITREGSDSLNSSES